MAKKGYRKYGNKKTIVDNIKFDSKKESEQYLIYKQMKKIGLIKDFKMQVVFELIPSQRDIVTKKVIERVVKFKLDFVIEHLDGVLEYYDVKAWDKKKKKFITTQDYILKRKLMLYVHGIRIKEV